MLYTHLGPHLALDDEFVYFFTFEEARDVLKRVPKTGGHAERLASFRSAHGAPAVDATAVYVATDWTIFKVSKSGDPPEELAKTQGGEIDEVMADETSVYFRDDAGVHVVSSKGGAVTTLLASSDVNDFAMSRDALYLEVNGYALKRIPKRGGDDLTLTNVAEPHVNGLSFHAGHLYWSSEHSISRISGGGGTETAVHDAGSSTPRLALFAVDASGIYFTIEGRGLYHLPPKGEPHLVTAAGLTASLDADHVYSVDRFGDSFQLVRRRR